MRLYAPITALFLAATTTAIDIRFTDDWSCNGFAFACSNINADVCCTYAYWQGNAMYSRIAATPSNWLLFMKGYGDNECISQSIQVNGVRGQDICQHTMKVHSAKWGFFSKKREEQGEQQPKEPCRQADSLYLADGTKYDIQGMSRAEVGALVEVARNGSGAAEVPEFFKAFEVEV